MRFRAFGRRFHLLLTPDTSLVMNHLKVPTGDCFHSGVLKGEEQSSSVAVTYDQGNKKNGMVRLINWLSPQLILVLGSWVEKRFKCNSPKCVKFTAAVCDFFLYLGKLRSWDLSAHTPSSLWGQKPDKKKSANSLSRSLIAIHVYLTLFNIYVQFYSMGETDWFSRDLRCVDCINNSSKMIAVRDLEGSQKKNRVLMAPGMQNKPICTNFSDTEE